MAGKSLEGYEFAKGDVIFVGREASLGKRDSDQPSVEVENGK